MFLFAIKTILADRGKFLVAVGGVVFSIVLVTIQGGLYLGLIHKASIVTDHSDADIWVGHRNIQLLDLPQHIPQSWIDRVRGVPGVARAEPYIVGNGFASAPNGLYENVWVFGCDPSSLLGAGWGFIEGSPSDLRRSQGISIDEFDREKLGNPEMGDTLEINGRQVRIVARTKGILPFTTVPYMFTSIENAREITATPPGRCSYFLVQTDPGADRDAVSRRIADVVPELRVFTADELGKLSQDYWMDRTGIGISFGASTLMGLLVGFVMVGQSLYGLTLDHLPDYATLKAIGANTFQLAVVAVSQSLLVANVGVLAGIGVVVLIHQTVSSPIAPIEIPAELLVGAVGVVFGICVAAAVLPFIRICRVDPATVLQG